jgi:very-short-patch-repair endonuclease
MRVLDLVTGIFHHVQMMKRYKDQFLARARELRREMTAAEMMLWRTLRGRGIGLKFRRQVPIGPYIVDFICIEARIIVELDGPPYDDAKQRAFDMRRDLWLHSQGWHVPRFKNEMVIGGGDIVPNAIKHAVSAIASPSSDPR